MERKEIGSNIGIFIILLFCTVCFLIDFIIIDKKINNKVIVEPEVIVKDSDLEEVESYKREKNIKIDYNRDYVYDAGYHNDNKYKEYDYCDGTTYTHDGFDVLICDNGSMRLSNLVVPYINIKSNDAYRINRKLKDLYDEYATRFDDFYVGLGNGSGGSEVLGYYSFLSDKILSVVVIYGYQQTDVLYPNYSVYNFDLSNGNLIDYDDMILLLGVDDDYVYSNVLENIYNNNFGFDIFYDKTVNDFKSSISDGSVLCFVNDDGVLEYIVNVYVPGGRGNIYYRFTSKKVIKSIDNQFYLFLFALHFVFIYNCYGDCMIKFIDKNNCYIDESVKLEDGCVIYPGVVIEGRCIIGSGSVIGPGCFIKDSNVGPNCHVYCSHIFSSNIGESVMIGPYAFIRDGVDVGNYCRIGSFVEVKKSSINSSSKVSHLSYIGDSFIGSGVNVGGGVITANYDGINKNSTIIDDGCFIGSNCTLVAPVHIGKNSVVGASSCIVNDVPENSLGIARSRQINKDNYFNNQIQFFFVI